MIYRNTLLAIAALAVPAALTGLVLGAAWGWGVLAFGLIAILLWHARHLARLQRWLASPVPGKVPEGQGIWDEVLAALHRLERDAARREQGLADALARMRRAVQALPDGLVLLDSANHIEWCNLTAETQLQLDGRADRGQNIANLVREPEFIEYLQAPQEGSVRITRGQGVALSLHLIPFGQEQKLLLSRDVTQAERVDMMRRDFVANVSHELRTPLTVLVGFLETVRELKLDPQRQRDYLGMMQEQAARMQRIIEDLLTLSALDGAPPASSDKRVPVQPLLERLKSDAEALSNGKHTIRAQIETHNDLLGVEGELASAFGNLVSNAIRYTPAGGTVTLAWREGPDGARFSVEDTGIGIEPEHIPRLTERFYRVDRSRSRETGGTGLGLAIAKRALARHEAILEIQSEPGRGSRFSARFPARRLAAQGMVT
ncbi:MAG TPA: phosphate regulon sensor histidine kinase PhoR [Burkholderiales bacterium]|nr:phosphate regulon sensor histidine kinase PhoR [Burkholderiales bacterium]